MKELRWAEEGEGIVRGYRKGGKGRKGTAEREEQDGSSRNYHVTVEEVGVSRKET